MATNLNAKVCAGCRSALPKKEFLSCITCKSKYDYECANITPKQFEEMDQIKRNNWKCPECCSKQPKTGNTHTPVRSAASFTKLTNESSPETYVTARKKQNKTAAFPSTSGGDNYLTEGTLRDILQQELSSTIQKLVTAQLNSINEQISGFSDSMSFINAQFEEMRVTIEEKSAIINHLKKENTHLQTSVKDLTTRLNIVELHMRECNIEINGIPEHKTENLINTVVQLGQAVKNHVSVDDIQLATRVAKLNKNTDKPRSVIVKLRTTKHRDALLAAVAQYNKKNPEDKLSTHHLGIGGSHAPIYVSEHLTPGSKSLHAAARIKAKEKKYRFTWIRNGKIYVRKDEFSQAVVIKNEDSLKLLV
ncbi:jg15461 [Pararge aegeria aegeria]|uniref:Jg15461 protein n=1 Tax=Pararge aegeria aegeria TaxID=348720 RepID=A0A8S4S813_9NEOP|nr:jg15461 [Pararge aegeria aegeria]